MSENYAKTLCIPCECEYKHQLMQFRINFFNNQCKTLDNSGYFPPPWNPNDYPEKTVGWLAFQDVLRKDPIYYKFDK